MKALLARGFLLELGAFFLKKRPQKQLKKPEAKGLELKWSGDPRRSFLTKKANR
jgi:hypothetical protein